MTDRQTIWMVVADDIPGEGIDPLGFFTTEADANRVAEVLNERQGTFLEVVEVPLDEGLDGLAPGLEPWNVTVDYETGQAAGFGGRCYRLPTGCSVLKPAASRPLWQASVWARDESHAISIANERRREHRAQQ